MAKNEILNDPAVRLYVERTAAAAGRLCVQSWSPTIDPLHTRAREAIIRLGLDGSRLETAVAVFGWGSDEANGSLLGLVGLACNSAVDIEEFYTNTGLRQFEVSVHPTGDLREPLTCRAGQLGSSLVGALENT